jgi:hypothetical protein
LVLYHVDLILSNTGGSPVIAALYRPVSNQDARLPPSILPALLWAPGQGYICLGDCQPSMWDAISGSSGPELVFIDKNCVGSTCEQTMGAALFRWQEGLDLNLNNPLPTQCMGSGDFRATAACGGLVPLGHFRGDSVVVELDKVTVTNNYSDRSELASREIYHPTAGRYYRQYMRDVYDYPATLLSPTEAEIIYAAGPPEVPAQVKVPEKLVLSFYNNYNNVEEVRTYFTPEAWARIGLDCQNGVCGCTTSRERVSRVMVKQLAYESDFKPTVFVVAQVVCVNLGGGRDPMRTVTWKLQGQTDGTWRLFDVSPGGEEFLCPRTGCQPVGGGE